ncbi:hypothetical protein SGGMMB4_04936 [Sodalis glossinidius str. 'morsitans']|uniref:Uncharacterized protein n=1 Tax=Sodalis glossinidius (strain morsitans) TaxID=343509 RepID=A0A193QMH9_SODGM|nr:hypothetical protein SGGMMB4_04936 [Sodalis glossinidius str. 'morsitans']
MSDNQFTHQIYQLVHFLHRHAQATVGTLYRHFLRRGRGGGRPLPAHGRRIYHGVDRFLPGGRVSFAGGRLRRGTLRALLRPRQFA